jgi:membrane protease YdiL (CAAX protease family)
VRKSGLAFFGAVLTLFTALGTVAQGSRPILGLAWSELFALLIPALVAVAGSNLQTAPALLLKGLPRAAVLALSVLVGTVGFLAAGALMALTSVLLPASWIEIFDLAKLFDRPPAERAALAIAAATLAPLCEEIAFRGWLLTALRTRHRTGVAIALAGLAFALMHLDPVRFPALLGLGVLFGWLAWRAGSIWPSVLAHATNNALGVALVWAGAAADPALHPGRPRPLPVLLAAGSALIITAAILWLTAAGYRHATPSPPPIDDLLVRRDPADASTRFDAGRVPRWLLVAILVGALSLFAIILTGRRAR